MHRILRRVRWEPDCLIIDDTILPYSCPRILGHHVTTEDERVANHRDIRIGQNSSDLPSMVEATAVQEEQNEQFTW